MEHESISELNFRDYLLESGHGIDSVKIADLSAREVGILLMQVKRLDQEELKYRAKILQNLRGAWTRKGNEEYGDKFKRHMMGGRHLHTEEVNPPTRQITTLRRKKI